MYGICWYILSFIFQWNENPYKTKKLLSNAGCICVMSCWGASRSCFRGVCGSSSMSRISRMILSANGEIRKQLAMLSGYKLNRTSADSEGDFMLSENYSSRFEGKRQPLLHWVSHRFFTFFFPFDRERYAFKQLSRNLLPLVFRQGWQSALSFLRTVSCMRFFCH